MAVLLAVGTATDVDPVVTTIAGFHDELVEIRVGLEPREPTFGKFLVGVSLVVIPIGIGGLGDVDVGCFTYCVLAGVCATYFDVELVAAVDATDDDRLTCKGAQGFKDGLAELLKNRDELVRN